MEKQQPQPPSYDQETCQDGHCQTASDRFVYSLIRRTLVAFLLCFCLYFVVSWPSVNIILSGIFNGLGDCSSSSRHEAQKPLSGNKVPLEAHVMSKCPDARDCLRQLIIPAMETIDDIVDFKLSFIASVSNKTSEIDCKHGPSECIGDILILCAFNLPYSYSEHASNGLQPSPQKYPIVRSLGFANCLISSFEHIPERGFIENCALEHGIDFDSLNRCASQEDDIPLIDGPPGGLALLRESALHSEALGVNTSCTVRMDETIWCVRDGGEWKNCAEGGKGSEVPVLVEEVEKRWRERN